MNWCESTLRLIDLAIAEDLGDVGDITSALLDEPDELVDARVVARREGVLCGLALAPAITAAFNRRLDLEHESTAIAIVEGAAHDGADMRAGDTLAVVRGGRAAVLALERTFLNFASRMCGVATLTRRYVDAARAASTRVAILDTRKTIPGWRELDKYAVRIGGGENHRSGLFDAILIKDNHLATIPAASLAPALFHMLNRAAERPGPKPAFVEVEVDSLAQLVEVFKIVGVHVILLDNFSPDDLRTAVELRDAHGLRSSVALEASGGVTLENVAEIASTGVERIAIGALTHSSVGIDIALDL